MVVDFNQYGNAEVTKKLTALQQELRKHEGGLAAMVIDFIRPNSFDSEQRVIHVGKIAPSYLERADYLGTDLPGVDLSALKPILKGRVEDVTLFDSPTVMLYGRRVQMGDKLNTEWLMLQGEMEVNTTERRNLPVLHYAAVIGGDMLGVRGLVPGSLSRYANDSFLRMRVIVGDETVANHFSLRVAHSSSGLANGLGGYSPEGREVYGVISSLIKDPKALERYTSERSATQMG
ncbi:MAG: hypothetical protein WC595_03085 [Candidatus Nanoarchaeia archaeon]